MKPPRSLKITDSKTGTGRACVPGDVAVCRCTCTRTKGDVVYASETESPYRIRVGSRDCCVGIEYGLLGMQVGGRRSVTVPPNLTYVERKIYPELPTDSMLVYDLHLVDLPEKWDANMDNRLSDGGDADQDPQDGE